MLSVHIISKSIYVWMIDNYLFFGNKNHGVLEKYEIWSKYTPLQQSLEMKPDRSRYILNILEANKTILESKIVFFLTYLCNSQFVQTVRSIVFVLITQLSDSLTCLIVLGVPIYECTVPSTTHTSYHTFPSVFCLLKND